MIFNRVERCFGGLPFKKRGMVDLLYHKNYFLTKALFFEVEWVSLKLNSEGSVRYCPLAPTILASVRDRVQ
jgi:hypothetical protein